MPSDPTYAGYGLVQWTPYTKYTNWIINQGFNDPSEMDANIFRILYEVANDLQWIATTQYNYSFEDFTHSTDMPYNLGMAFLTNYERPLDPNQPARGTQSQEWYEFLGGVIPPIPSRTKKKKYPWAVMTNKIRQKRLI